MIRFLDHLTDYITSASSAGAYGELSRAALPSSPEAASAVVPLAEDADSFPLRKLSFRLLVRDASTALAAERAQALHALFAGTWVASVDFAGAFRADSFPRRGDVRGELTVFHADYTFLTVSFTP